MGSVKSINGLLAANIKSVDGLLVANVKSVNGLEFATSGPAIYAPTDILLSRGGITEGYASGSVVGVLSSVDADSGDSWTYTLVSGTGDTDNDSFTIDGSNLKSAAVFAHDTKSVYSIRVRSTDSGSNYYEKALTVVVYHTCINYVDEYINRVRIGDIDNSSTYVSSGNSYQDFTNVKTNMIIGLAYSIRVDLGFYYSDDIVKVWVDWDHDGDFGDENEGFLLTRNDGGSYFTGNITPPTGSIIGETRMRIFLDYNEPEFIDPESNGGSGGECEDYSVNVKSS